jgi:hypothetical protein
VIKFAGTPVYCLDWYCRNTANNSVWGNILGYYRTCCDNGTSAYAYAIGHDSASPKPHVIFDNYPLRRDTLFHKGKAGIVKDMIDRDNLCIG